MPAQLLALTEGPSILLDKPIMLLGRDLECDIRFESRKVSRKHCCIAQVADYLVVRDLGSTNGVRINGTRVLTGRLRAGDELTIGNYRYQVRWEESGRPRRPIEQARPPVRFDRDATAQSSESGMLESCEHPIPLPDAHPPIPKPRSAAHLPPPAPSPPHDLPSPSGSHHPS